MQGKKIKAVGKKFILENKIRISKGKENLVATFTLDTIPTVTEGGDGCTSAVMHTRLLGSIVRLVMLFLIIFRELTSVEEPRWTQAKGRGVA